MQGKTTRCQAMSLALVHVFRARCPPRSAHHTFTQLDEQEFAMQVSEICTMEDIDLYSAVMKTPDSQGGVLLLGENDRRGVNTFDACM